MAMTATGTTDIQSVLIDLGVEVTNAGEREISGRCPVHLERTGHVDRSPSWSMNAETGLWICYSCGGRGTLVGLISTLTGDEASLIDVHSFLINSSLSRIGRENLPEPEPEIDWISYSRFDEVPASYLYNRNLDASIARSYGIRWDTKNKSWVIPIVSPMGHLMGHLEPLGACPIWAENCRNPCNCRGSVPSGWGDSNSRPPDPQSGALTKLRHSPWSSSL